MVEKKVRQIEEITYQGKKRRTKPKAEVKQEITPEEYKTKVRIAYKQIISLLKKYVDLREEYYNIATLWIIGTYFHKEFPSYPFLFFNAMKGSGKSRVMNLIICLSKEGSILNSMTEAVLFRTTGTLGIDEFEGVSRKSNERLRELLNSAYKKGVKVKRMKQMKTMEGTEQVVEEFEVYRPIVIANIWGMESVLGDRCISLVLERSNRKEVTNLIEIFREENEVKEVIQLLNECSLCRCSFSVEVYKEWNSYVCNNYTYNTNNTYYTNNINYTQLFKSINLMDLNGRELELSLPLCLIANDISGEILKETTLTLKTTFEAKRQEELVENYDISLYDFTSQQLQDNNFKSVNKLTQDFKNFLQSGEEWINTKWMGRALKRLDLIKEKRRKSYGVEVILNVEKALEKLKIFR